MPPDLLDSSSANEKIEGHTEKRDQSNGQNPGDGSAGMSFFKKYTYII
jgi:hypothetical protein